MGEEGRRGEPWGQGDFGPRLCFFQPPIAIGDDTQLGLRWVMGAVARGWVWYPVAAVMWCCYSGKKMKVLLFLNDFFLHYSI
jgi:hypothetical protein